MPEMVRRAIHIFPEFPNSRSIEELRAKYDPLAGLIPPHITLVFPFESDLSTNDLADHVQQATAGLPPFRVVLSGVTGSEGQYLFLNVKVGNDRIIELHDRLYTGILREHLYRSLTYIPHVTVGRIADPEKFAMALQETKGFIETFETTVREIVVERIEAGGDSTVEFKTELGR